MKKRNKKYNPKKHRIDINSAYKVIRLSKPVQEDTKIEFSKKIHGALEAITKGKGDADHFNVLASTVDITFMMAMNLFQDAYKAEIELARQGMFRIKDRYIKHGTFAFDGEGYQAIKELIAIHDELLNNVTGAEVDQFIKARTNAIRGGNFYKGKDERLAA